MTSQQIISSTSEMVPVTDRCSGGGERGDVTESDWDGLKGHFERLAGKASNISRVRRNQLKSTPGE